MSGSTFRRLNLTVSLTAALLTGLGTAQEAQKLVPVASAATPTAAASAVLSPAGQTADAARVCLIDESLLEVHVGATNRGTFLTRLSGQEVWVDPGALRPEEAAYFDAELRCGTARYVQLLPSFSPVVDSERLTLTFQPAPQLLAGHSLTVVEPPLVPAETAPLFSIDYSAVVSALASGGPNGALGLRAAVRARYLNGPVSASIGTAADFKAGGGQWVPSAQVSVNVTPTFSVQLAHNVGYVGDATFSAFPGPTASLFTGARLQLSNTPGQSLPVMSIDLPFQAHLRVRVDGLLVAEYDVAAGSLALRDLPLHLRQGRIEVEIRDETGTRTVVQTYLLPSRLTGSADVSLDAGWLDSLPYINAGGRLTLSPQVDVEATGRMLGTAVQAQARTVYAPNDTQVFSVGVAYSSGRDQPFSLTGSAWGIAAPFTFNAFAEVPVGDVGQTRFGAGVGYVAPKYDVQWKVGTFGLASGLTSTVQGNVRVSPELTISPALTVRRDGLRVGLALDYHPQNELTIRGTLGAEGGSPAVNSTLSAQYRPNDKTQLGLLTGPAGAALNLHYADKVKVDAAIDTQGQVVAAMQGSVYLLPGSVQFDRTSLYGTFVTVETGLPSLQIFANGQLKGVTDASGRLVFSVTPGRAVSVRVDPEGLPFDVTLGSDSATLNLPGPGGYRFDWRRNFIRSRFVTFHWADGTLATFAEIRFQDAETGYTDGLGTGFLAVESQSRQATLTSQDGTRTCTLTIPANAETVTCAPSAP